MNNHDLLPRWTSHIGRARPSGVNSRKKAKNGRSRNNHHNIRSCSSYRCHCLPQVNAVNCRNLFNTLRTGSCILFVPKTSFFLESYSSHQVIHQQFEYLYQKQQYDTLKRSNSVGIFELTISSGSSTSLKDTVLRCFVAVLFTFQITVYLFTTYLFSIIRMGNEGSASSSQESTPISEYPSMYSIHSRVRSSVESTRAPSPMEAPEPDLSHLTAEEVAQIRSVMERAKHMQHEESTRARRLEEEYIDLATKIEREASLSELADTGIPLCPLCNKMELTLNQDGTRSSMNVCVDCEKMTCTRCGGYQTSLPTRIQEWVCVVCDKRRRLMMTTGMWYHGYHPESELPLEKQIVSGTNSDRTRGDSLMVLSMDASMNSNFSQTSSKDSRGSRESREDSDITGGGGTSWEGSRCGGDSGLSLELSSLSAASSQNSELARHVYEQNKMKGPGATLPKSESDEFSDRTSDLDFDELASERSRVDGGSSTDESNKEATVTSMGSHRETKRQKHRPKSLSLSHSHSHTSSDEEDGSGGSDKKEDTWSGDKRDLHARSKPHSSVGHLASESSLSASSSSSLSSGLQRTKKLLTNTDEGGKVKARDLVSIQDLIDSHAVNSPTPPRSPSWREGLESPPFSPRRRDSYPGKRRGSLSPKEKNNHFTYTDISPPSRQLSLDELYGEASTHSSGLDNGVAGSHATQKPSPMSPDELKGSFISTTGQTLVFDMPAVRAKPPVSISGPQTQHADLYTTGTMAHSTPVMDLATYAATIANSTASLTSMSVSPTNLLPQSSHQPVSEPMSPDSADSVDSSCSSPVSPGYYDNAPPPGDEVEEVELANPSSKSIDFQGSKRQKARPPSTDWSPVIDLSPILDVSPSVEEAEQEDMLAQQMEELERQRSREEAAEGEYDDEESESVEAQSFFESKSISGAKKSIPLVIPRIPAPPSAKKLKQQLNEELDDYDIDDVETPEDVGPYIYGSSLKRCGNFEDISRLGSDHSLIKHTSELLSSDRLVDDIDVNDASSDFPFFSCTTQSQTLCHSTPSTSTTVSSLQAPCKQLPEKAAEEPATKRIRDMKSLITDEFHKVAEDMENIVKRGAMDVKPIPPPKPKRRLPDPEMVTSPPPAKLTTDGGSEKRHFPIIRTEEIVDASSSIDSSVDEAPTSKYLPRQDSTEKKKAKDMKAKPSPILVQYIEAEEQSVSPHYKVMESPPTPETKTIKREFSDSTSVSPNSSPDQDVYAFPSPVTPPDSDSSPPKPHSPSSPVTDFEEDSSILVSDVMDPYRASSPYDNAKPCHKPRRISPSLGTLQAVSSSPKADLQIVTSKPEVMRPPISPRKSIRKFDDQNINDRSSPLYENVKDLTTQEYLKEQQKHAALLSGDLESATPHKGLTRMEAISKGLGAQYAAQPTEILAYPLVEVFSARKRSSSAPSTELQEVVPPTQRPEPAVRSRSATTEYEQEPKLERTPSVRDKIRAFEEIANKPKEMAHEKPEPKKEPRREGQVMKDKRTDSGSSTSSSGSSAKTSSSSSRSSSDLSRPQGKESPKNGKKIRRKLPPIPVGEEPVVVPKSKLKRAKPPTVKRGEGVDKDDASASPGADSRRVQYQSSKSSDSEGYFVGPSNRISRTQRDSDESMNEDDMEVARLTTVRGEAQASKRKAHLLEVGKSKSLDSAESLAKADAAEAARMKPQIQRTASLVYGPKDETDEIIDALIDIYGIPCTEAMKSLKKRLQEELRRVTKDRKRKLEELEEIRALQMQIGALKSESDAYARSRAFAGKRSPAQHLMVDPQPDTRKKSGVSPSSSSSSLTPRSSPQVTPRRQRHKRQSSDPMISKFSPIKEDKDIESDFQTRIHEPADNRTLKYHTDDSSLSGISDSESTRSEPARDARYFKPDTSDYSRAFYTQRSDHGGSAEKIHYSGYDHGRYDRTQPLSGSRSEQQLSSRSRTSVFYLDDEEAKAREEKKAMLQYEIMKRKQQLEETARLKNELLKLARARQSLAHSYDDIPRQYGTPVAPHRPVPRGIIKPIDDESHLLYDFRPDTGRRSREHSRERSRERSAERRSEGDLHMTSFREDALDSMVMSEHRYRDTSRRLHSHQAPQSQEAKALSNYSSTEYLAHKQESASRRYIEEPGQYGSQGWIAGDYPSDGLSSTQAYSQPALNKRADSSQSLAVSRRESTKKDSGIVSSVTLPNIYADRAERDFRPSYRDPGFVSTSISDTDGSPASDITPAMPLLDDVKIKSRTIIRNIGSGSRPVSAEFCAGEVEDLLNAMYRVESDNSVDADEPIMKHMTEGGVTILKQIDRKRRPAPVEPYRYSFPIKRILVTRDAKDKSITGNGLGMKIVGGKQIPGTKEVGAYVTAIYPIIADQLHGELDVGDQVLEWNGIHLTGLSAQEVQDTIAQTNGEIEMVVRAQAVPVSLMELTAQPESCRSSYDNLALPTYEESVKDPPLQTQRAGQTPTANRQGVDPRQLAAQLEGIREAASPAENSPSSSHQDVATPSVSSPCSTPRSDPTSTSSDRQQRPASALATGSGDKPDQTTDKSDRHAGRRRRRHSPNPDKSQHHQSHHSPRQPEQSQHHQSHHSPRQPEQSQHHQSHHSQRQPVHQHYPPTSQQQQQQQQQQHQHQSAPQSYTQSPQLQPETESAQSHHSERDALTTERVPPSRRKTDRRKQQEAVSHPAASAAAASGPEKPALHVDPSDESTCSSPALNDRLRASPPLDTRRSVKTRTPRKGKDIYSAPSKSPPLEVEQGEDCGLGAIQLQISHDDFDNTLNVHVIQARNLRPRDLNGLSDPFVKLYLLPGRGPENKRRTKHIPRTLNPEWHQTVMFQDVARLELQNKVLEITVWDYDRFKTNDFLGELIIELREFAFLDNKPHWYPLKEHVIIQSFELPKSTVLPPKPTDNGRPKSKSPRHGKKHGVASLQLPDSPEKDAGSSHRRQSLGTITGNGASEASSATRQVSSATNSPIPARRPRGTKSPIKTKSNGLLYR